MGSIYPIVKGRELLDRGLVMRDKLGTEAAALWFEKQGISYEFGYIALRGSEAARRHGIDVSKVCGPGWRMAD